MLRIILRCVTSASDLMILSQNVKRIRIKYSDVGIILGDSMVDWGDYAKRVLRSQMHLKGMSYANLVTALSEAGVKETEANLRNKVSRGSFTAAFLFQCLSVMGVNTLHLT